MKASAARTRAVIGVTVLTCATVAARQDVSRRAADRVEPIDAIVAAFQTHSIVTMSDWHGDRQQLAFTLAVLRDRRLPGVVDDIVVEGANARYQALMDRYVRGEDLSMDVLRGVWEDTTLPHLATTRSTAVPDMYRTVREVNAGLPPERKLRVLLGDPPIDWSAVRTAAEYRRFMEMRDSYPAALIQLEVLAKGRRALVIYGQGHAQRKQIAANFEMDSWQAQTVVSILERTTATRVFSVWSEPDRAALEPRVASWPVPALALVRGTTLGAIDFARYSESQMGRATVRDGKIVPLSKDQASAPDGGAV